jgi:integrase
MAFTAFRNAEPETDIGHVGHHMARRIKDKTLDARAAREKLRISGKPYYRLVEPGLHLGYRKLRGRAGTWVARHYVGNQEYKTEGIGTADDLSDADGVMILNFWQATERARERAVSRAHAAAGKTGPLNVADVINEYLAYLEANKKTAKDARYRAEAFILPKLGIQEVSALTTGQLRDWLTDVANEPARLRTKKGIEQRHRAERQDAAAKRQRKVSANRVLAILRAALNRAWKDGRVASSDAWERVDPFKGVTAARIRHLDVAEAKRLVNACDSEFRALVQAALHTGCRYGELTRLTVEDFDRDSGTLRIHTSKSGKSRHVVLTREGITFFSQLTAGRAKSETMLRRPNGEAWTKSLQSLPMARACKRAGIIPISFHGLRHTYASLAVMAGMPLMVLARNLGHIDTKMVEAHYGHLADSFITKEIRERAPQFGFDFDTKVVALP